MLGSLIKELSRSMRVRKGLFGELDELLWIKNYWLK